MVMMSETTSAECTGFYMYMGLGQSTAMFNSLNSSFLCFCIILKILKNLT